MDIFFQENSYQDTAQACLVDLTPPTFSGIVSLVARSNGSLRVGWAAASDSTPPIRYDVFIQAGTSVGLFSSVNKVLITEKLTADIFTLADGSTILVNGQVYHVGVRAVDAVGNQDSNTASLSAISSGVAPDSLCNLASQMVTAAELVNDTTEELNAVIVELNSLNTSLEGKVFSGVCELVGIIEEDELVGIIEEDELVGQVKECQ